MAFGGSGGHCAIVMCAVVCVQYDTIAGRTCMCIHALLTSVDATCLCLSAFQLKCLIHICQWTRSLSIWWVGWPIRHQPPSPGTTPSQCWAEVHTTVPWILCELWGSPSSSIMLAWQALYWATPHAQDLTDSFYIPVPEIFSPNEQLTLHKIPNLIMGSHANAPILVSISRAPMHVETPGVGAHLHTLWEVFSWLLW